MHMSVTKQTCHEEYSLFLCYFIFICWTLLRKLWKHFCCSQTIKRLEQMKKFLNVAWKSIFLTSRLVKLYAIVEHCRFLWNWNKSFKNGLFPSVWGYSFPFWIQYQITFRQDKKTNSRWTRSFILMIVYD